MGSIFSEHTFTLRLGLFYLDTFIVILSTRIGVSEYLTKVNLEYFTKFIITKDMFGVVVVEVGMLRGGEHCRCRHVRGC